MSCMQRDQVDLTALAATYMYTINHIRTETQGVKEMRPECRARRADQRL